MSDDLAARYQAGRPPDPPDHLSDQVWEAYACDELSSEERARANAHIVACAACAATARALLQLQEGARAFDPAIPSGARVLPFLRRPVFWAGGLLAAGLVAIVLFVPRPVPPEEVRGRDAARVETVSPSGALSKRPDGFTWRRLPEGAAYRVKLYAEDGRPLWTSPEVGDDSVALPAEVQLAKSCYWKVEALQQGEVVATSRLTRFQISP